LRGRGARSQQREKEKRGRKWRTYHGASDVRTVVTSSAAHEDLSGSDGRRGGLEWRESRNQSVRSGLRARKARATHSRDGSGLDVDSSLLS
jgi:hypothetical protein